MNIMRSKTLKTILGLQLADVVATTFRRAVWGTLQLQGWRRLGRLLVHRESGNVHMIDLGIPGRPKSLTVSYGEIVNYIDAIAKPLWSK